jgi:hypothetical protein
MGKHTRLKKFARHLLATTCLTAGAAAVANAQVITEGTTPAPADFGNNSGSAYLLPNGTTQVNGVVTTGTDPADFFTFEGLQGGTGFSFAATMTGPGAVGLEVLNSSNTVLVPENFYNSTNGDNSGGTVPTDGLLVFGLFASGEPGGSRPYTVNLTATQAPTGTPEPGTLGVMGLGLAAGAAIMRRRKKKI